MSTAAFSNLSFNDEDELRDESPSQEHCASPSGSASGSMSSLAQRGTASPSGGDYARHPVVALGNTAGYDAGTWPRKHKRQSAKLEPFSKK